MLLRAKGFKPTTAEYQAIQDSLQYKPNQTPLVNALKDAVLTQRKLQQRAQAPSNPVTIGINQYDPNNPGVLGTFGVTGGPDGSSVGVAPGG